ncbi:MAG: dipeptidase [Anaerolineales bacterium]|jgi:acetylornithine deacetylase/succinyl-diaminopimelate desuccinylase-like protein
MSDHRSEAIDYAENNKDRYFDELVELTRIPSISADSKFKDDMKTAADWLVKKLKDIGMDEVQVMKTAGHPVVYAECLKAGKDAPTVLIYGHYDVQPPDPLDLWETPPFEPTLRNGNLYGRGASDMKGQVIASISAVDAIHTHGGLPVNIKFLIEGEEEIGSPSLAPFIEENKILLSCDFALNPDGGMLGADLPTIPYALRGMAYFEINVQGPTGDLHSGIFGGTVVNPANELARLIGGMMDGNRHITLPGFYDRVREMDKEERDELARLPMDEAYFLKLSGAQALDGEKGFTPVERVGGRPSFDVNGFLSGYTGEGGKTVLPSKAMAKISFRLVPEQDPDEVHKQLLQYLKENASEGITWEVEAMAGAPASITPRDSMGVKALAKALESVWGKAPLYFRVGGSIPVVSQMETILDVDSVLSGFGLPDDNLHAPNEKLTLEPWYKGIKALIHYFHNLAE